MKKKNLTLAATSIGLLVIAMPAIAQFSNHDSVSVNRQAQQTRIQVSLDDLREPHLLIVTAPTKSTRFTGQVTIDGKVIQALSNSTQIDLSPNLSQGVNIIEVRGSYSPPNSSIEVELTAPNTQVTQQTGGSGYFNQTLIIDVR